MNTLMILFTSMSLQYHIPPGLLKSLCYVESKYKVTAVHKDDGPGGDSLGICQIKLSTAKEMGFKGNAKQLMQPHVNIKYAAKYLSKQLQRYGKINKAVIAYNRGNARNLTTSKYQIKVYKTWRDSK